MFATAITLGVLLIVTLLLLGWLSLSHAVVMDERDERDRINKFLVRRNEVLYSELSRLDTKTSRLSAELGEFRQKEAARLAHLKRIAPSGARAANAQRGSKRIERVAATQEALTGIKMPPREEVVAGVREAREARKALA